MDNRFLPGIAAVVLLTTVSAAFAGPILKPRKYHGPIPRSSLNLGVGFLGGAANEEMYEYFNQRVPEPVKNETQSNDFGNAPLVELTYTYKTHPQFAVRGKAYAAFLTSDWTGVIVPVIEAPDTVSPEWQRPSVDAKTTFDVVLFALEASALYYFTDAAVKEFQPYIGGGFTFGLPYQKYTEKMTVREADDDPANPDYQPIFTPGQRLRTVERDQLTFEAGVQGILGMLYYFTNKWAVSAEGRYQMLQSKFPLTVLNENDEPEEVKFDVDYTGFMAVVGITYAF
jgi:opacity protein-like surface antigen